MREMKNVGKVMYVRDICKLEMLRLNASISVANGMVSCTIVACKLLHAITVLHATC